MIIERPHPMPQTILIVEDEPAIADSIVYALRTEGYTPLVASTGGEAEGLFVRADLVILDVGLPDISGFELCRRIRQRSAVPILFLTARTDEVDRIVGLEIGADDYVTKPFSPRELTARVRAILRRAAAPQSTEMTETEATRHGPFEHRPELRQITVRGTELELTRYEYQLLITLLRRPGWVYTRTQLMEQAWDDPELSDERTVDAHIKSLRAKCRAIAPDEDPIVTHRGVGYALRS